MASIDLFVLFRARFDGSMIDLQPHKFYAPSSKSVKETLARNELLYQARLLEKDKELHDTANRIKALEKEVDDLRGDLFGFSASNKEMM